MNSSIKIVIKIALITAGIIILFQAAGLFFIYKYFTFDYYLTGVAAFFLVAGYLLSKFNYKNKPADNSEPDSLTELTNKEIYILQLIIEGKSNKEIAAINYVEVSTIKTHINNIYAKLGLNNRKEAINRYKTQFITAKETNIHPFST